MGELGIALRVTLVCSGLVAIAWLLFALAKSAKRGGKRMHAMGAAMMLFGWGHMRDPRNDTVAEARDGRIRKGTHSGEPLDDDLR